MSSPASTTRSSRSGGARRICRPRSSCSTRATTSPCCGFRASTRRPLPLATDPPAGRSAAILGYPQGRAVRRPAGRIGTTQSVLTQDAYGNGPVSRLLTPMRGLVRPGNSGGPMVDSAGRVVTTVFAATTAGGPSGGFGVANSTVAHDVGQAGGRGLDAGVRRVAAAGRRVSTADARFPRHAAGERVACGACHKSQRRS